MRVHTVPRLGALVALSLAAAAAWPSPAAANHLEAKMYAVTTWNAGCGGSSRPAWDDMADAWYDELGDSDWYFRKFSLVNGDVINSKYADASVVSFGNDTGFLDDGDAVMLAWHGAESGDVYVGSMRVNESGTGDCTLRRDEMELGDRDLEFLHISSCQSMDDNQWDSWWQAFDGVHQVDAFHGLMWIGDGLVGDYEDFADDAFDDTIADAWLDNMYVEEIDDDDDQCPVAYAVGANSPDMWLRIATERYDFIHSDPRDIGWWGVMYIEGCDPAAETTIGSNTDS